MLKQKESSARLEEEKSFADLLAEVRQELAAAGLTSDQPSPIGVPLGYQAAVPQSPTNVFEGSGAVWDPGSGGVYYPETTPPRYYEGDEYIPAGLDRDAMIALQARLEAFGLSNYTPGAWDPASQKAFLYLLATANASGKTWQDVLAETEATGGLKGPGARGAERAPLQVRLTNPDDIRAVLQAGAQQVYGKYVDEADIESFIQSYHAQQTAAQTQDYNQQVTGGTMVDAPRYIDAAFEQKFKAEKPNEAGAAIFQSKFEEILSALRGR